MKTDFENELRHIINRFSIENESDTPDWILCEYIIGCLNVFNSTIKDRERYYGRGKDFDPKRICNPKGQQS